MSLVKPFYIQNTRRRAACFYIMFESTCEPSTRVRVPRDDKVN